MRVPAVPGKKNQKTVISTFLIPDSLSGCEWVVLNSQIASESHHISVVHVYDTDGEGVEGWRGGVGVMVCCTTERQKQTGLQGDLEDFCV